MRAPRVYGRLAALGLLVATTCCEASPLRWGSRRKEVATKGPLPDYALTYAPVVYLYSNESWWPSSVETHLANVQPEVNYTRVASSPSNLTIANVNFAANNSEAIYLTSKDNVGASPQASWITSEYGAPKDGKSDSPTHIVAVDKSDSIGPGFVDIFYHWEYNMIRFLNGEPESIFYSQHSDGFAYAWDTVEKEGLRPVVYSATGSHANYPTAGRHYYAFPFLLLWDTTDAGHKWDVAAKYWGFWYSEVEGFVAATGTSASVNYLNYAGSWGDEAYRGSDQGQYCIESECHYCNGPYGPISENKNLTRATLCVRSDCDAKTSTPWTF
ncbi:hypothetical protein RQP46_002448 [Phenoliferia psychrophenolica]